MRARVVVTILALLCLAAILIWLLRPGLHREESGGSEQPGKTAASVSPSSFQTNVSSEPDAPDRSKPQAFKSSPAEFESWKQRIYRPIEFYGKVVDENDQSVEGAIISFSYNWFIPPEGSA